MCGPSTQEQQIAGSERQFMQELMANYNTNFANQQQILAHLNGVLGPILALGPTQTGFSPAQRAGLTTQAIDTTAAGAAATERAIATETAGRGDSGNLAEAGNVAALKAGAASTAEGQLSAEELGITEADYATGRANFQNAVGAEEAVAGGYSPLGYAGAATSANTAAFNEANDIQQQINQQQADIAGGIASLATGLPINIPTGGGSAPVGNYSMGDYGPGGGGGAGAIPPEYLPGGGGGGGGEEGFSGGGF